MNQQILIRLPEIYDCGGKTGTKDSWFIFFSVRNPRTGKMERIRKAKGINKFHSEKERRAAAEKMCLYWTDKLKAGWSPFTDTSVIYDDNLEYQTAIKNYRKLKAQNGTFRFFASQYLDYRKNELQPATIQTYRSKLRIFDGWLESLGLHIVDISTITQPVMVDFFNHIIDIEKLSKVSVDNYRILLEAVFDFIRRDKKRKLLPNPCFDLPGTKRVNDSAAYPIQEFDIPIFKEAIKKCDPQLWLAIGFEYYCFLRPRKEIRFIRVGDIDFGRSLVRVREVKAKQNGRVVTIPDIFLEVLRDEFHINQYPREFFVFGKSGKPCEQHLSINNLSNRWVAIRRKLNMPEEYKLYSWKHTGNIRADMAGIPRRELQEQNGHTTIQTTEIYMRNKRGNSSTNIKTNFPGL